MRAPSTRLALGGRVLLAGALAACGSDAGSGPRDAAALEPADAPMTVADGRTSDGGGGLDLAGTWVSHVTTSGTITVPLIDHQPATIDIVLRILATPEADQVHLKLEICRLDTQTTGGSLIVDFPAPVLALLTDEETVPAPTLTVGGAVPLPAFAITVGEDAGGAARDDDGDGHPGVTIPTTLLATSIQAYSSLKITLMFQGVTLVAADQQQGTSSFTTAGQVFDTVPLDQKGAIAVTPGGNPTFTANKLAGDVPCSTVAGMFNAGK